MKKFFLPILLLHLAMAVNAATYYFSTNSGDDSRSSSQAKISTTPWKSITKLNSIMSTLLPGDRILFKRGESFDGSIIVTMSGTSGLPITFGAYGSGNRPIINGFATVSGWSQVRSNVWEGAFAPANSTTNMVTMNDQQQNIGRYPNSNAANQGYLTIDSHSGMTSITSSQLSSDPNWTGAEVVMRKVRWITDRNVITNHSGNTLNFIAGSAYEPSNKYGFFIQNSTNTLDQNGEWYYDKTRNKLQMYFSSNNPNPYTVRGSVIPTLVSIVYQNYLTFNNLVFAGANTNTFSISNANNITINNCAINFSGGNAISAVNSSYVSFTNSTISNTNNDAVYLQNNCPNAVVTNNVIKNTAVMNGMGQNGDDTYQAVVVRGDNSLVQYNEIDSTGFNALVFKGNNLTISNNLINYFDFLKDDGAGIYNYSGSTNNTVYQQSYITGNIITNGIGATKGSSDTLTPQSAGIYLDDNANHLTITGNTISNCSMAGINNHNGHELTISGNTMFNNKMQFQEVRDYISSNPVRNCIVTNNIMFSKVASQLASSISTVSDDIAQFGSFDGNHYCRPMDDNYVFSYSYYPGGTYYQKFDNLAGWQAKFGLDKSSKGAPVLIPASVITSTSGVNKYVNGTYAKDASSVYGFSPLSDIATTWNPSKIDAGTLQVTSNHYTNDNNFLLNLPVGSLTAGKSYMLSFSLMGSTNDRAMDIFLRKIGAPYTEFTPRNKISVTSNRTDMQFGIVSSGNDDASCIMMEYDQADGPIWIDNVQLQEANVTLTNPDDYIVFQYNSTKKAKSYSLDGTYYDAMGIAYTGKIVLQPYTSVVLTKQTSNTTFKVSTDAPAQAMSVQANLVNSASSVSNIAATKLNWQVSNQKNTTTSYEVERSSDAKTFTSIATSSVSIVSEAGSPISYHYEDNQPLGGKSYYRIKQYDSKGVSAISKIIVINNISFTINPNPAANIAHITFDQPVTADNLSKEVVIRNTTGTFAKTLPISITDNMSRTDIDVSTLKPGMYIMTFTSDGQSFSKSFLKQ